MKHLLHCMVMASYCWSTADLVMAVEAALKVAVRDEQLRNYYVDLLKQPSQIPSPTTLYRHRLSFHLGFCQLVASDVEELLADGIVRYGTVDSSQQGSHDLVHHGQTIIPKSDLVPLFRDVCRLVDMSADDRRQHNDEVCDIMQTQIHKNKFFRQLSGESFLENDCNIFRILIVEFFFR